MEQESRLPVTHEALQEYRLAYKEAYPHQKPPQDPKESLQRMVRKGIAGKMIDWNRFLSSSAQSLSLSLQQYIVTVKKDPLRIAGVRATLGKDAKLFANSVEGPPLDLSSLTFSPSALIRFAALFPRYLDGSDIETIARSILAMASEKNAISDSLKVFRLLKNGPTRYFKYENCRFVIGARGNSSHHVVTIEQVFDK